MRKSLYIVSPNEFTISSHNVIFISQDFKEAKEIAIKKSKEEKKYEGALDFRMWIPACKSVKIGDWFVLEVRDDYFKSSSILSNGTIKQVIGVK